MPSTYFIVRATIADPAARRVRCVVKERTSARCHEVVRRAEGVAVLSDTDPAVHIAQYQFAYRAALDHGTRRSDEAAGRRLTAIGLHPRARIVTLAKERGRRPGRRCCRVTLIGLTRSTGSRPGRQRLCLRPAARFVPVGKPIHRRQHRSEIASVSTGPHAAVRVGRLRTALRCERLSPCINISSSDGSCERPVG